jgi:hypothetical protein
VLAARLSGLPETAFPDGPPAGDTLFSPADHVGQADAPVDITVVADADWLDDTYYVRSDPAVGDMMVADNLTLALNLIDMAAGDRALIEVRSRTPSLRPMSRVDRLREAAETRYLEIQDALEQEIADAEAQLDSLTGSGQASAFLSASGAAQREEAERLRHQIAETRAELRAVERLFGDSADGLVMSSTKSAIGHLLGAAGAVESIFSILAIRDGVCPPTLNLDNPSVETAINLAPKAAVKKPVRAALSNSFGFGGTNASVVFVAAE